MDKIRFGIIGAGGIARTRMIPGILDSEHATVTALMGPHKATLDKVQKELADKGITVSTYEDLDQLLSDPAVDAVYVASPVFAHKEQVIAAAQAGKHVLAEKPLALTAAEAEEMVRKVRQTDVKASAAFMMRFQAYHQQIRQAVAEGRIGDVVSTRAQQVFWYPRTQGAWRQEKAKGGGGALMDVGVHMMDLTEFLTGSSITAVTGFVETRTFDYDADDVCNLVLRLDNGAAGYVDAAFDMHPAQGGSFLELYGTKGTIVARDTIGQDDAGSVEAFAVEADGSRRPLLFENKGTSMYSKEVDSFCLSILEDIPEEVPLEQGLHIQKCAQAAYQAAASGKLTKVEG